MPTEDTPATAATFKWRLFPFPKIRFLRNRPPRLPLILVLSWLPYRFSASETTRNAIMDRILVRRLLAAPPQLRAALVASSFPAPTPFLILPRYSSSMPTIAQPEFWKSLIPKPFRPEEKLPNDPAIKRAKAKKVKSKEWNPATFYIIIFLLIGSMSINLISIRQSFDTFMRQSDVRIGLLREVIERVQRGEKVDVEQVLGTGDPDKEKEWAEGRMPWELESHAQRNTSANTRDDF